MKKIKGILLAILTVPVIALAQKTVTAESIIADINKQAPVNVKDAQITGDLDFTKLTNMKLEQSNSDEKVYISTVTSSITFTNCTFSGKVLGYFNPDANKPYVKSSTVYNTNFDADVNFQNCTFQKGSEFKYSNFNKQVSFAGCHFNDEAMFKYTKFNSGPNFNNAEFKGATIFKYVEFPAGFDFSHATFNNHADFKYAKFMNNGSFSQSVFNNGADFKYTNFSKDVNFKGAKFSGSSDLKYATLDDQKITLEQLTNM
jgi:hypothetical protein